MLAGFVIRDGPWPPEHRPLAQHLLLLLQGAYAMRQGESHHGAAEGGTAAHLHHVCPVMCIYLQ